MPFHDIISNELCLKFSTRTCFVRGRTTAFLLFLNLIIFFCSFLFFVAYMSPNFNDNILGTYNLVFFLWLYSTTQIWKVNEKAKKIFWWHQNAGGDTVVTPLRKMVSPPASRATPVLRGGWWHWCHLKTSLKTFFYEKTQKICLLKKTKKIMYKLQNRCHQCHQYTVKPLFMRLQGGDTFLKNRWHQGVTSVTTLHQ